MKVCEGRISSPYGYRIHPLEGVRKLHNGIDIACPTGTPVFCPADGTVVSADVQEKAGKRLEIQDSENRCYIFLHLSEFMVYAGDEVKKGEQIALSGATGAITGPHLHYSVKECGQYVDPTQYI